MNTLKNAALLIVMGGVLYFVYITLNKPPAPAGSSLSLQHESLAPPDIDIQTGGSSPTEIGSMQQPVLDTFAGPPTHPDHSAHGRDHGSASSWQMEPPAEANSTSNEPAMVPVARNGSSFPQNNESAYQRSNDSIPSDRRGSWNSQNDNQPPVAPEFPDLPGPTPKNEIASPAEPPATNGSNEYAVTPATMNTPRVDPNVQRISSISPLPETNPANSASLAAYTVKTKFYEANSAIEQGRFQEALVILTTLYRRNDISSADRRVIIQWLDPLAAKVIYSPEHTLAEAYRVGRGENLLTISQRMQVPWQLLQNINGIRDPQVVVPNTMLKVVPGPFSADIHLANNELTLYLKEMYAGRFSFTVGDEPPTPGQYDVKEKSRDRAYYGRDQRMLQPQDPGNPYGGWWIDLGAGVCLHGTPLNNSGKNLGCLSFSPKDAEDLFSILSQDSPVTIR